MAMGGGVRLTSGVHHGRVSDLTKKKIAEAKARAAQQQKL